MYIYIYKQCYGLHIPSQFTMVKHSPILNHTLIG